MQRGQLNVQPKLSFDFLSLTNPKIGQFSAGHLNLKDAEKQTIFIFPMKFFNDEDHFGGIARSHTHELSKFLVVYRHWKT